jgi:tripartite-type tricarboxylate transporter receptor subunit TctC
MNATTVGMAITVILYSDQNQLHQALLRNEISISLSSPGTPRVLD